MKEFFRNQIVNAFQANGTVVFAIETGKTKGEFLEEYTPSGRKVVTTLVQPNEYVTATLSEEQAREYFKLARPDEQPADCHIEWLMKPIVVMLTKSVTAYSAINYALAVLHARVGGNRVGVNPNGIPNDNSNIDEQFATLNGTLFPTLRNYAKTAVNRQNGDLVATIIPTLDPAHQQLVDVDVFRTPFEGSPDEDSSERLLRYGNADTWHLVFNFLSAFCDAGLDHVNGWNLCDDRLPNLQGHFEDVLHRMLAHACSAELYRRLMNLIITIRPELLEDPILEVVRMRIYAAYIDKKGRFTFNSVGAFAEIALEVFALTENCEVN